MEILEKAQKMLEKYPLCDHCLGRQFAFLGYGLEDHKRGETIKTILTMMGHRLMSLEKGRGVSLLRTLAVNGSFDMAAKVLRKARRRVGEKQGCYLCEDRFKAVPELVGEAAKKLGGYEHATFLIGIRLPVEVEEREDEFKAEFEVKYGENMRNEFSREIGKGISETTEKETDYKRPDVVALINPFTKKIAVQANPLYIAGRYRKLVRGIPQSKWLCRECGGRGCQRCDWTGKMYQESVEEIIAAPALEKTQGEDTVLHAAGREDVDARMLGHGRPFILEVKRPKRRHVNLQELAQSINEQAQGRVKVLKLRLADKDAIRRLKKGETAEKLYRAIVEFERSISDEEIGGLEETLANVSIHQQTPLRVLHRRPDRVREKHIYEARVKRLTPNRVDMRIRCQGGLYIKELITGDEGRTDPNVAKIVGAKAAPLELDVLGVIMRRP